MPRAIASRARIAPAAPWTKSLPGLSSNGGALACPCAALARSRVGSVATVSHFPAGLGLSSLKALDPVPAVVRYEREAPGELLHMTTRKLDRIVRPSHGVTSDRRNSVEHASWEFAQVAIDNHSRASFVQMLEDEREEPTVGFLKATVAHYKALGATVKRLRSDNASVYRSKILAKTCQASGIKHAFTQRYRTQTKGKANGSSRRAFANVPTVAFGLTAPSALPGCPPSWLTTTSAGRNRHRATSIRLRVLAETTCCDSIHQGAGSIALVDGNQRSQIAFMLSQH